MFQYVYLGSSGAAADYVQSVAWLDSDGANCVL